MNQQSAHDLFFDNWSDATSRLNDLEQFFGFVDGFLQNEETYFRDEAHVDLEIEFLPLFAETFPPILHSSLIISAATLLEQEMRGYAKVLLLAIKSDLKYGDLSGSVIERFRTAVTKLAKLPMEPLSVPWEDTIAVFEIRNCLVHASGSLSEFPRPAPIKAFADRYQTPIIANDVLRIGSSTSRAVLDVASKFVDGIYRAALRQFP